MKMFRYNYLNNYGYDGKYASMFGVPTEDLKERAKACHRDKMLVAILCAVSIMLGIRMIALSFTQINGTMNAIVGLGMFYLAYLTKYARYRIDSTLEDTMYALEHPNIIRTCASTCDDLPYGEVSLNQLKQDMVTRVRKTRKERETRERH